MEGVVTVNDEDCFYPANQDFSLVEEESTGFKQGLKAIQEGFEVDN